LLIFLGLMLAMSVAHANVRLLQIPALSSVPPKLWTKLRSKCDAEIAVAARPIAVLAPQLHYSADGTNAKDAQAEALAQDSRMAYRAGLCFALSKDDRYALHVQRIVDAWAQKLTKIPNAQGVADINFNMPYMVFAVSFAAETGHWDQVPFRSFLTHVVAPLSRADKPNNHGNWGVLLNASIAAYLGDEVQLKTAHTRWNELMQSQISADGTMPLEICRSDSSDHCGGPHKGVNGIAYTNFALLPATLAAEIFYPNDKMIYQSAGGAKLKLAYEKAVAWTVSPETFPFYDSNNGKLNGVEKCGYFAVLAKRFSVTSNATCKSDPFFLQMLYQ
jgi:Alginate lyase